MMTPMHPLTPLTRRSMLQRSAAGFGHVALAALLARESAGDTPGTGDTPATGSATSSPLIAKSPHFAARAKRVVFLFMSGGPSQVDTFDPKPLLQRDDGKKYPFEEPRIKFGETGNLLKSPWKFKQYGQSGLPVSE